MMIPVPVLSENAPKTNKINLIHRSAIGGSKINYLFLRSLFICTVFIFGQHASELQAQTTRTWALSTGGSWATASNWSPSGVPQANDNVVINTNITTSIKDIPAITLNNLTITANCLMDAATSGNAITVSGTMTVASGITLLADKSKMSFIIGINGIANVDGTINMTLNGQGGTFTSNGRTNMSANGVIAGTGAFVLGDNGTLAIASTAGITATAATGNIRTATRTYSTNANYIFNGTAAQVTGDGLPASFAGSLTINNPASVTLTTSPTTITSGSLNLVSGQFTAASQLTLGSSTSSVTLNRSGGTYSGTIQGSNWYNVVYTGTDKNTGAELSGSGLRNITVNLTGGNSLSLSSNLAINGILALNAGNVNTGSFSLMLNNASAAAISGGTSSSYINGTISRAIAAGGGAYFFPIGNGTAYAPVTMNLGSGTTAGTLLGSTTDGDNSSIGSSIINTFRTVNRSWNFSNNNSFTTNSYSATFEWFGDQDASFDPTLAIVGRYNGSAWSYPAVSTRTSSSIQIVNETAFGSYQIGKQCLYTAITSHPAAIAICEGTQTTFSVAAIGDGTLSYQWSKGTEVLTGATSSTYTTGSEGNYKVLVSGECQSATSNEVALTYKAKTFITVDPVGGAKCSGDGITVSATGEGTVSYKWYRNDTLLSGAITSTLAVSQAGNYKAEAIAECGTKTSTVAAITMNTPTAILSNPKNASITYGDDTSFSVSAEGTGALTYRWQVYSGTNWNTLTDAGFYSNATGNKLNVNDPIVGLTGFKYKCFVSALCGTVESSEATISISKAVLTVTGNNYTKIYGEQNPTLSAVISGYKLGQNLSSSGVTGAPTVSTIATIDSGVGTYDINVALGSLQSSNYSFTYVKGSLKINPAVLTITARDTSRIYGDINPAFQTVYSGFKNGQNISTSGISGAISFKTAAQPATPVGTIPIIVDVNTLASRNYTYSILPATLTIKKATLQVTTDDISRTYGDMNPDFTATISGFKNGEVLSNSGVTGLPLFSTSAGKLSPVGVYDVFPALGELASSNYDFNFNKGTLTVNKAPLSITAINKSRIYGVINPDFEVSYIGFKNNEDPSVLGGAPALTTSATITSPVGPFSIDVAKGTLADGNYTYAFNNGTLTVSKATLSVQIDSLSKIYGQENPTLTYSISGYKNGEDQVSSSVIGSLTLYVDANELSGVGDYPVSFTANTLDAPNYNFSVVDGNLKVNKATLNIKAENKSRIYGDVNPAFTFTVTGFKNSEQLSDSVMKGIPAYTTIADTLSDVGTYDIWPTLGALTSANYDFSFSKGTLEIQKAPLTVKAVNKTRKYGEANPVFDVEYVGLKNGQDAVSSDLEGAAALSTTADTLSPIHEYTISIQPGNLTSFNYTLTFVDGTLTVEKAVITVTVENKSRKYGEQNPAPTYTYSGFKNSETETTISMTGEFLLKINQDVTTGVGVYPVIVETNTLAAPNYLFSVVAGSLTIEKAFLQVKAEDKSRIYGDPNPSFTFTVAGYVNGEDVTSAVLTGTPSFTTAAVDTSSTGDYDIIPSFGQLAAPNYTFTFDKGILTIAKAALTVRAMDTSRAYGKQNPVFEPVYNGFKNGEDYVSSDLEGLPTLTTTANNSTSVGTYAIDLSLGNLTSRNYAFSVQNGTLTINQASLSVLVDNKTKVYGQAIPSLTYGLSGFENGETESTIGLSGSVTLSVSATASSNVGEYPITASQNTLAAQNYSFNVISGKLTITKATLTVTADNKSKFYGSANPALTVTYTGLISGQTLAQSDVRGTPVLLTSANDSSIVGVYPVTFESQNLTSNNYAIIYNNGTLTINKANITVKADDKSREYGDANPELTFTLNGLVLGQDLISSGIVGMPVITTAATSASNAGNYAITPSLGTLASSNYAFVMTNGNLTVSKAVLSVKADDKSRNYGAANPTYTASYSGFKLGQDLTTSGLRGNPSMSTTATQTSNVGTYPIIITMGNLSAQNYSFNLVNGTLTVNKATVTVTANNLSRGYGSSNPALTVTYSGFANSQTFATSGITGSPAMTTMADSTSNVGTYPISAAEGTLISTNYTFAFVNGTLTITKAVLNVTADTKIKIYGDANPVFTATYTGLKLGQDISTSGITGAPSLTTTAIASSNVGTYAITAAIGTMVSGNYSFTFTNGSLIIGKATLLVTGDDKSKTYGSANPALTVTYTGFKLGQILGTSGITGSPTLSTTALTSSNVGTYPITVGQGNLASTNYAFTFVNGTLTVNKAILTVTADNKSRIYGSANPVLTVTYAGFVSGQTFATSGVSGSPSLTTAADNTSPAGTYPITVSEGTMAATNYSFNYVNGTLTVGKASITVSAEAKSKVYGDPVPALTYLITGFVNGETSLTSDVKGDPAIATIATQTSPVGTYTITSSIGTLTSVNYAFVFVNANLVVSKASILVKANDASRAYGAANPSYTSTYAGFVNGETLASSGITGAPSYATSAVATSAVGTYPITPSTGTLSSSNYSFSFEAGVLTVTKAVLTVQADNKTRAYGASNPVFTYTVTGFVNGQNLASSGVTGSAAMSSSADLLSPVGLYPITIQEGTLVATNYTFNYVNGNLTVSKAVITITADNSSRTYGASNPVFTAAYNGFVNGESFASSGISGLPAFTTTATSSSPVGTYAIVPASGTLAASNYSFSFVNGTLTVSKATLSVKADDKSKVFGTANPALTVTFNGFVNGETLASSGVTGTPAITTTAVTNSVAGRYTITAAQGTLVSGNYTFSYVPGILSVNMGISFTKQDPICLDGTTGSVTISASGGNGSALTYSVDNGTTFQSGATVSGLGVGTYKLKIRDADGNESVTTDAVLNIEIARWIGSTSGTQSARTDWANAANWSTNKLPTSITHVIIPANFTVNVNGNAAVASVQVAAGSTLNVASGFRLTISGKCGALPN